MAMPNVGGKELALRLRQCVPNQGIVIVRYPVTRISHEVVPATTVLQKPFTDTLAQKVRTLLDQE